MILFNTHINSICQQGRPHIHSDICSTIPEFMDINLSSENLLLLVLLWLRSYPCYSVLCLMFNVHFSSVSRIIHGLWPKLRDLYHHMIQWPSNNQWNRMHGTWPDIPMAVGAIDGMSHEIYRPGIEPQELFYFGHRNRHCLHTQVIVDCLGNIVHIHSGFLGHTNDAQSFSLMAPIGPGQHLSFPQNLRILADRIYSSRYPLLTEYKKDQIRRRPVPIRGRCKRLNKIINGRCVRVEHKIGEIKKYSILSSKYRHPRKHMAQIVELVCSLIQRRTEMDV